MRFIFVILSIGLSVGISAQEVIRTASFCDTGLLRHLELQVSNGSIQPVVASNLPLNILVFLSPECPLSINYTKTLNELATDFKGQVNLIGIIPGRSYLLPQVDSFVKDYKLKFKVFIDTGKKVTKTVDATVTPEVVLFQDNGRIVYRGAIDDWAVAPGKNRRKASNHYLIRAIESSLRDKQALLSNTRPVGCLINNY
ncbi:redoxin domain-containing protein [Flavitalea antarctica]